MSVNMETQVMFIFSLPRAGSTFVQRILASHDAIATTSEPWILLPYLYTMKERGAYTEYSHINMVEALKDFCKELPGGKEDYLNGMREFIMGLYGKVAGKDARYFLDKTPRYHLVADDVIRLFPDGKFIFLWRNPLSIVASMMESWSKSRWNLYQFKVDLFDGLINLIEVYKKHTDQVCPVRYEDLLESPEKEWRRVFAYLNLPFDKSVLSHFSEMKLKGQMGDPTGVKQYRTMSKEPFNKWKQVLRNPIRKAWCRRYLRWIGKERLAIMGYDLDSLIGELNAVPYSSQYIVTDLSRIIFGVVYSVLDLTAIKHKLQALPAWHRVHKNS